MKVPGGDAGGWARRGLAGSLLQRLAPETRRRRETASVCRTVADEGHARHDPNAGHTVPVPSASVRFGSHVRAPGSEVPLCVKVWKPEACGPCWDFLFEFPRRFSPKPSFARAFSHPHQQSWGLSGSSRSGQRAAAAGRGRAQGPSSKGHLD